MLWLFLWHLVFPYTASVGRCSCLAIYTLVLTFLSFDTIHYGELEGQLDFDHY